MPLQEGLSGRIRVNKNYLLGLLTVLAPHFAIGARHGTEAGDGVVDEEEGMVDPARARSAARLS